MNRPAPDSLLLNRSAEVRVDGLGPIDVVGLDDPHLHREDLFLYEAAAQQGAMFGVHVDPLPSIDTFYSPGQIISFGDCEARPHHTPGHCPGGVCLQIGRKAAAGKDLFVGDTLFAGSIGRTDLWGGDTEKILESIREKLFTMPASLRVVCGHGPDTTIGEEKKGNPFVGERANGSEF